jgi:lipopolysaccharide biosynthesis glycosyltransferase
MEARGVNVIFHRLSFEDSVLAADREAVWKHTAKGAMLRLDIPEVFGEYTEQILYTDVDIMFLDDPSKYRYDVNLFAFSSEFQFDNFNDINTGVMVLNLPNAKRDFPDFIEWTKNNLNWIPDYDQGAIRTFFSNRWDRLDQRMIWKPYWSRVSTPIITHFHGPKPTDFDPIMLSPRFGAEEKPTYWQLYTHTKPYYFHHLRLWLNFAHDLFSRGLLNTSLSHTIGP